MNPKAKFILNKLCGFSLRVIKPAPWLIYGTPLQFLVRKVTIIHSTPDSHWEVRCLTECTGSNGVFLTNSDAMTWSVILTCTNMPWLFRSQAGIFNTAQSQLQPFQYLLLVRHWTEPCVAMRHPHHKANPSIWCPTYPYGDQVKTVRSQLTHA